MTHVSKKVLDTKTEKKLSLQLAKFFSNQSEKQTQNLFTDLLTSSERIMLIKRLAIVIMITEEHSTYRIAQTLKVSDSTVRDIKIKIQLEQYDYLVAHYKNKNFNSKEFWKTVEVLLRAGLPSRGSDRWQSVKF